MKSLEIDSRSKENEVWKCSFANSCANAVRTEVTHRVHCQCQAKEPLSSCTAARWKAREDQARALDQSWSRVNSAPLTCSPSVQTSFRWSSLGRQWGEQPFNIANNLIFSRNCIWDGGWQHLCASREKLQHRPEVGYGKQQGSNSKAKQEELCWEFPQICWFFPRTMGHAPSVGR